MAMHTPDVSRRVRRFSSARYVVRVGSDWSPVRAAAIWSIADLFGPAADAGPGQPAVGRPADSDVGVDSTVGLGLVLGDPGMIAPPRSRRRDRRVSSRAVFYQSAHA